MTHQLPNPTILIVDDDPGARLLHQAALESGGFTVLTAANGPAAFELFKSHQPQCLVLDVVMPGMDGYELCAEIRRLATGQRVPILILTSLDQPQSISLAYAAGATDFSQKGIAPLLLMERVRFLLRASDLQTGLLESEARLAEAQHIARIGHWEMDLDGHTIAISPMALELLGLARDAADSIAAMRRLIHEDDLSKLDECLRIATTSPGRFRCDFRIGVSDTEACHLHLEGQTVERGHDAASRTLVLTLQDTTQLRRAEERAHVLSHYDAVTALPNLTQLRERLAQAISAAELQQQQVALLVLDIEHFNRYNDNVGYQMGDELLRRIGQRLGHSVSTAPGHEQSGAVVARIGGDEFALMLPARRDIGQITEALRAVQAALQTPFVLADQEMVISATIGVAVCPDDGADPDTLLRLADAALHQAKELQRGGHQFYSAKLHEHAAARSSIETDLRRALQRGQLELWFQPRIALGTLAPVGCEALLRWRHPDRGMVSPAQFIPLAEELGLIVPIGEWVFHEACRAALQWSQAGMQLRVSANVSAVQFQRASVAAQVMAALDAQQLPETLFELEVTEGVLIERPQAIRAELEQIKERGVQIALDDFGTGFSSLSYLRQLPIDYLKVDRSFIADLDDRNRGITIVQAILGLARGLKLRTVAEGVESLSQFDFLVAQGCEEVQGFLFARPMPFAEMQPWMERWLSQPWERGDCGTSMSRRQAAG